MTGAASDGADDDDRAEHQPGAVRRRRAGVELVADGGRRSGGGPSRWPTVIRASVPARIPAPWSSASQRSSTVNSRLRARARIGPIGRQAGPAGVAGDLAADGRRQPGDGERQGPQLLGDVGRRGAGEQVGPAVDEAAGERARRRRASGRR